MRSIFDGIRVIDFTANVAGPASTTFLADMGAEVIKVEKPGLGDDARLFPPYINGFSQSFVTMNRGKKGVVIDLKRKEGVKLFKELVSISDVVFENHKPGTMGKLGLGYEDLKDIKPDIIMLSLSGYGQYGPLSDRPAYDSIIQAMTGFMDSTGFPDGPPVKAGPIVVDLATAMFGAYAVAAALFARERTGEGEYIDLSMYDVGVQFMTGTWGEYTVNKKIVKRSGNRLPYVTPFDTFKAKDGFFMICSAGDVTFGKLCECMDMSELFEDERFSNMFARNDNEPELKNIIEKWVSQYTVDELLEKTSMFGVPGAVIQNPKEVIEHPHTIARGLSVDINQPNRGKFNVYGPPIKTKNSRVEVRGPAPEHGQDNEWLLSSVLLKDKEDVNSILESGIMG